MGGSSWILVAFPASRGVVAVQTNPAHGPAAQQCSLACCRRHNPEGPDGLVPVVGRGPTSACFIGYCFSVEGKRYTGLFALYGREENVERVHKNFPSGSIRVRYNPADPSVSSLVDLLDPRFEDLEATQNPAHLVNAPLFDLEDAIGR